MSGDRRGRGKLGKAKGADQEARPPGGRMFLFRSDE